MTNEELDTIVNEEVPVSVDYKNKWLISCADLENFKKRTSREIKELRRVAVTSIVRDILPVLDNLRRALVAEETAAKGLSDGVNLVIKQMESALAKHGIKPIPTHMAPFNPMLHSAIKQVESDVVPPMTIIEEFQCGYTLDGHVIRPSTVIVSKARDV
jgi:molecular chaperone GrpE